jgi:hypothetical protein
MKLLMTFFCDCHVGQGGTVVYRFKKAPRRTVRYGQVLHRIGIQAVKQNHIVFNFCG